MQKTNIMEYDMKDEIKWQFSKKAQIRLIFYIPTSFL